MSKLTENLTRELKESGENQVIYGSKVALKQLKKGNVEKIYVTLDCPLDIEQKIKELNGEIIKLDITKDALKDLCKTPFNISVLSILKSELESKEEKETKKEEKKEKKERQDKKEKGKEKEE